MNQKKSQGFTLTELLGVIVVLALVAIITVPIAIDILSKARKEAYLDTGYGIIDAIKLDIDLENLTKSNNYYIKEGKLTREDGTQVAMKGTLSGSTGEAKQRNGVVYVNIENDKWCLTNYNEEQELKIYEKQEKQCKEKIELDETIITIIPTESTLKIQITDANGIMKVKYTINDTKEEKNYNANTVEKTVELIPNETYQIKIEVTNQVGRTTEKSLTYQANAIPPELILPETTQISSIEATSYDLRKDVIATENNQQLKVKIEGDLSPVPKDYTITYTATDLLGNNIQKQRTITVVKEDGPIISLDKISTDNTYKQANNILLIVNHKLALKSLTYQLIKDGVEQEPVIINTERKKHIETYVPLVKSGTYTIKVHAIDINDKEYTLTSGTYFIDNDRPTIELLAQVDDNGLSTTIIPKMQDIGGSNIKEYLYCYGINCPPTILEPNLNTPIQKSEIQKNLSVCVIVRDYAGNESKKVCIEP